MTKIIAALRGIQPNRIAVYLTGIAGLLTAVAPAVASLDTTSAVGAFVGFAGIVQIVDRYLKGWQAHEERQHYSPSE